MSYTLADLLAIRTYDVDSVHLLPQLREFFGYPSLGPFFTDWSALSDTDRTELREMFHSYRYPF